MNVKLEGHAALSLAALSYATLSHAALSNAALSHAALSHTALSHTALSHAARPPLHFLARPYIRCAPVLHLIRSPPLC